jgi:hypothetical protein
MGKQRRAYSEDCKRLLAIAHEACSQSEPVVGVSWFPAGQRRHRSHAAHRHDRRCWLISIVATKTPSIEYSRATVASALAGTIVARASALPDMLGMHANLPIAVCGTLAPEVCSSSSDARFSFQYDHTSLRERFGTIASILKKFNTGALFANAAVAYYRVAFYSAVISKTTDSSICNIRCDKRLAEARVARGKNAV